jgi:hypothetical protein
MCDDAKERLCTLYCVYECGIRVTSACLATRWAAGADPALCPFRIDVHRCHCKQLEDDSTLAYYEVQNEELCRLRTWFEKVADEPDKPVKITRSESTENAR